MSSGYESFADPRDLLRRAGQLSAKTMIFDVEPLVAFWDSSQEDLGRGIAVTLDQVGHVPGLLVVCFATNSARQPSVAPASAGLRVMYVASAGKPLRTARYRDLPRPGLVIGDQILTDGLLARRLGYTLLHYSPAAGRVPLGPRVLSGCGELLRPLIFAGARPGSPRA
jgi:predicted HAD superfamily phosphohydrolase YqeG